MPSCPIQKMLKSAGPISITRLVKDTTIVVSDTEDLNIRNNICQLVTRYMNHYGGNYRRVREELCISERTLYRYMEDFLVVFDVRKKCYVSLDKKVKDCDEKDIVHFVAPQGTIKLLKRRIMLIQKMQS